MPPRSVIVFVVDGLRPDFITPDDTPVLFRLRADGVPVRAEISGLLRGMLKSGVAIRAGVKVGDIDPRLEREYCYSISDKARAISGGVL